MVTHVKRQQPLVDEIDNTPTELRRYLVARCEALLETPNFIDVLPGLIFPDESLAERVSELVGRIKQIAAIR
jgi:hypothetical protein